MTKKRFIYFISIAIFSIIVMALISHYLHKNYQHLIQTLNKVTYEGKKLDILQKRWSNKNNLKRFIHKVEKISDISIPESKADIQKFVYKNLTSKQLNDILNTLYHTPVQIKQLYITYDPKKKDFKLLFSLSSS